LQDDVMGSQACIDAVKAAAGGKLTDDEIIDVFMAVENAQKKLIAEGKVDNLHARLGEAMAQKAEQAKIDAAVQQRNAALNILARDRIDGQIRTLRAGGLTPRKAVLSLMEGTVKGIETGRVSAYAARLGYEGRFVSDMYAAMIRDVPDFPALVKDEEFGKDVVREMYELRENGAPGITKNESAKKAARVFATYAEMSRKDVNAVGGVIGKLDGWAGPQSHDADKLLRAGKDAWIATVAPKLDVERSFGDIDAKELNDILSNVWDTIVTGVRDVPGAREKGERVSPGNLGKKAGRSRVLHFKNPDEWMAYNAEFGRGNIITAMLEHQRSMAGYAAQMQFFGPNPEVMLGSVVAKLEREVSRDPSLSGKERKLRSEELRMDAGPIRHAFDIMSGITGTPVKESYAKWGQGLRAVQSLSKLGGAVISSFTDAATAASNASFRGQSWGKAFANQIASLVEGRGDDVAMHRLLIGEGADSIIGDILRNAYAEDAPMGMIARAQDTFFRLSGLTWWTDRMRGAAGDMIAREVGEYSGLGYDALKPRFRHVLKLHGIDAARWDVLRQAAQDVEGRGKYVYGSSIAELPDEAFVSLARPGKSKASRADRSGAGRPGSFPEPPIPAGMIRVYHSGAAGEGETGRWVSTSRVYASNYRADLPLFFLDVPETDPRVNNPDYADQGVRQGFTFNFETTPEEAARLTRVDREASSSAAEPSDAAPASAASIKKARRELEIAYRSFVADETNFGVLETDARSRRTTTFGLRSGTVAGEAVRALMQFKGFPIAFTQRVLGRALLGGMGDTKAQRLMNNLPHTAGLIAGMFVLGSISMTAKDALRGQGMRDWTNGKTWTAALLQSGGAGIYGDLLFGEASRFGQSPVSTLAGPLVGTGENIINLFYKAKTGDLKAATAFNTVLNNTPFVNLWYLRPAMDFLILNSVREAMSPGFLKRQETRRREDYGQTRMLPAQAFPTLPRQLQRIAN
jgi:hypothetical protein